MFTLYESTFPNDTLTVCTFADYNSLVMQR